MNSHQPPRRGKAAPEQGDASWYNPLLKGVVVGILSAMCFWIFAAGYVLLNRNLSPAQQPTAFIPTATIHRSPTQTPNVVTFVPQTPQPEAIRQAEQAFDEKRYDDVKEILLRKIYYMESSTELADAYRLLARSEWEQGHYQLAATYYEALYRHEPRIENLYQLAIAHDASGNQNLAFQYYRILLESQEPAADEYRQNAQFRIDSLAKILKNTPTPLSTPWGTPVLP